MTVTTGFKDTNNLDIGTKYVTKEYLMEFYPDLVPAALTPQLYLWGRNLTGQLGDGQVVVSSRLSPVETVSRGTNWRQVACGQFHTAAIKTDGTLWCWGRDNYGQLGDNSSIPSTSGRSSPVTTTGGGTTWRQVSCGGNHTAAIKTDGTLWSWGLNAQSQLGDSSATNRSSPVTTTGGGTTWRQVSCGGASSVAVKTDGTLWAWGSNSNGKLGDGTASIRSSPVTTSGGGTNWRQAACGEFHTAAVKTDGTLWTWGRNAEGQLGDNSSISSTSGRSSPTTTISGGTNWKQVACGFYHTAAVKTDGTLWTWGRNAEGQLGDNTGASKSSPVTTTGGGTNWKQVACGSYYTAAIKTDGTLWSCGYNSFGTLGDNTTVSKRSLVTTVVGGTNWKQVAGGFNHTAAIRESEGW